MTELDDTHMLRAIANVERILDVRLESMDKALKLARDELTRVPTELDRRIASLKELLEQKNQTLGAKIDKTSVVLENNIQTVQAEVAKFTARLTTLESTGAGRSQITGPMWAIGGAVLTTIIVASLVKWDDRANVVPATRCAPITEITGGK